MNKLPYLESNRLPSQLNTSLASGVASQLASQSADPPHFDGVTIDQMSGNPLYQRIDEIDKIGLAKQQLQKSAKTLKSNMKKVRYINDLGQRIRKPSR